MKKGKKGNKRVLLICGFICILLIIILLITKNNVIEEEMIHCQYEITNDYGTITIESDAYYTDKINKIVETETFKIENTDFLNNILKNKDTLKKSYENLSGNGLDVKIEFKDNLYIITITIDYNKLTESDIENLKDIGVSDIKDTTIEEYKNEIMEYNGFCS